MNTVKKLELDGRWDFKAVDAYRTLDEAKGAVKEWMSGTVPGTVHTDLLAHRVLPDPFYRMNENDVQWVHTLQWLYRREFTIPKELLEESVIELVAEGLDTFASISINGRRAGETANMFVEHRLDVKRYLRAGVNRIEILFDSPMERALSIEKKHGPLRVANDPHRVYARKAQYSYGWDWGPKLPTSGIWRSIRLEAFSAGRLHHPFARIKSLSSREAVVELSIEVETAVRRPLTVGLYVAGEEFVCECESRLSGKTARFNVVVKKPKLWWPNGYGAQPMYSAVFSLREEGIVLHEEETAFALRTVELERECDAEGESFILKINGTPIYCKGADWIPSDNFIPRIADTTYETLLTMARDAHMTMIRVWGGGVYEQEIFYELCDRLGLMIWHDFMYACGEYPAAGWFLKEARHEAEKAVKRLRNHPSIVLWCGNNECEWLFCTENPGKSPDAMTGSAIFREILPSVCAELDGTRPYWRSSPFGKGFPNEESNGNRHQWMVWSFWKDYKEYLNDRGRFVTEFGFQAPATKQTYEHAMAPGDRTPWSPVMEHHNKQVEGPERLMRFLAAHHSPAAEFDEFIYKTQLVQAEALKTAVEHWRRRKFLTAASLFWQLNDCWPVSSWAVIDSELRPKAAYYYSKRFFAPLLLSFGASEKSIDLWLTNDTLRKREGMLEVRLLAFDGEELLCHRRRVSVKPNGSAKVNALPRALFAAVDPSDQYVTAVYTDAEGDVCRNSFFFAEPKHSALPTPKLRRHVKKAGDVWNLHIRTDVLARAVAVECGDDRVVFSDNFFDLDPGTERIITFSSPRSRSELEKLIRVRVLHS